MANIYFSSIANGSVVSFNPATDVLVFDDVAVSAASLELNYVLPGYNGIAMSAAGKSFTLSATVSVAQLSSANLSFADGSRLLIGDDSTSASADQSANSLVGTSQPDSLLGLSGDDTLSAGSGDDRLDGGTGGDLMRGGRGADLYIVDDIRDVVTETYAGDIVRVSSSAVGVQAEAASNRPQVSADGRYVVFQSSAGNLVPADGNGRVDLFVKDLQTGGVKWASTTSSGAQVNSDSQGGQISDDGRYVLFDSRASDLIAGDSNGYGDVFLKDLHTGVVQRVSTSASGAQGNSVSQAAEWSADGRYVLFQSLASNLVDGDSNGLHDIFVKNVLTGAIQRANTNALGAQGQADASHAQISADGNFVLFDSTDDTLVSGDDSTRDVFLKNLATGAVQKVSANVSGAGGDGDSRNASFSADGRYVAFETDATNLAFESGNALTDVMVKDLQTGAVQRLSTDSAGLAGNSDSFSVTLSGDGRYAVFSSFASNLVWNDINARTDVFVKDLLSGLVMRVSADSLGAQGNAASLNASISTDGRYVIFESSSSAFVPGDGNSAADVFRVSNPLIRDTAIDTVRASVSHTLSPDVENLVLTGAAAINGIGNELANRLTGNAAVNLLDGGAGNDTLEGGAAADVMTGGIGNDTFVVSDSADQVIEFGGPEPRRLSDGRYGQVGNGDVVGESITTSLSSDGKRVLFLSTSSNLQPFDDDGLAPDLFLHDQSSGGVIQAVLPGDGPTPEASIDSGLISADGRTLAFTASTVDSHRQVTGVVYLKDLVDGSVQAVSTTATGTLMPGTCNLQAYSADGSHIAFDRFDLSLPGYGGLFVKNLATGTVVQTLPWSFDAFYGDALVFGAVSFSADGRTMAVTRLRSEETYPEYGSVDYREVVVMNLDTGVQTVLSQPDADAVDSRGGRLSADGRHLLISSPTSSLVAGDSNSAWDIFAQNLETGAFTRVSTTSAGAQANGNSFAPDWSADGRYVVFESAASNLVSGDINGKVDVFVKDTVTGAIAIVSALNNGTAGNGDSLDAHISADGTQIVFNSAASSLLPQVWSANWALYGTLNPLLQGSGGVDTVNTSVSYTLPGHVENLVLTGSAAINGTANTLANTITGNAGDNLLNGGSGNDTLIGGAGNDSLTGTTGNDSLVGGSGNDSYTVDSSGDLISETSTLATEIDSVSSSITWTLGSNLEKLTLNGSGATSGVGNALANTIAGNSGNNSLNGGSGNDTLSGANGNDSLNGSTGSDSLAGGSGNDSYTVDSSSDLISETSTLVTEIDTVTSSVSWALGSNLEKLILTGGGALNGTGNYLDNSITGNSGSNRIGGGSGNDVLTGGTGLDTFRISSTLNGLSNVDTITDWRASDDSLELENNVFLKLATTGALSASYFRANATGTATDSNDYIVYETDTGKLFYDADGNGTGAAVLFAKLADAPAISSVDIFVT